MFTQKEDNFIDQIINWAELVGIKLDRDPDQVQLPRHNKKLIIIFSYQRFLKMMILSKMMEDEQIRNIFTKSDLIIISSVIKFTIERIEARPNIHNAEKQTLVTLQELENRIEKNLNL